MGNMSLGAATRNSTTRTTDDAFQRHLDTAFSTDTGKTDYASKSDRRWSQIKFQRLSACCCYRRRFKQSDVMASKSEVCVSLWRQFRGVIDVFIIALGICS